MSNAIFLKDPDAVLDYTFDWTLWLTSGSSVDTITGGSVMVASGVHLDSLTYDAKTVTAWISGGSPSLNYDITCRIQTTAGRIDDRTITLMVQPR